MERHHTQPPHYREAVTPPVSHHRDEEVTGLLSQSPIVCRWLFVCRAPSRHPLQVPTIDLPSTLIPRTRGWGNELVLLRKEVIQPHLPVRLPCYDFVPIADPTFDGSLPEGLGHRLRVLPTFMT